MTEWYLGDNWDEKTRELFEQKLKRAKGSYNKAQYLRIKGSCLLESGDLVNKIAGIELLNRVTTEYPNEISNVMFAYEQLGDYYFNQKKYEEAELNFRKSISFYREKGRSGTSGIGDIKLAETVLKTEQAHKNLEMYNLLTYEFKNNHGSLTLRDDIFRYHFVLARLANELGKENEAKEHAQKAFQLQEIKESQFDRHPQVGVIKATNEQLIILKSILKGNI